VKALVSLSTLIIFSVAPLAHGQPVPELIRSRATDAVIPDGAERRVLLVAGHEREYFLIRPPTARGPSPVVFVLHGGAVGDGRQTFRYGFQELGARDGVVTVHPSGIGSCESRRQLSAASSDSGALRCVPRVHRVQLHHARLPRRRRPAALFFVWCGVQLLPDVQKRD